MDPAGYEAAFSKNLSNSFKDFRGNEDSNYINRLTCGQKNTILHIAAVGGNKEFAEKILEFHPSLVQETNAKGETALHIAARFGSVEVSSLLIDHAKRRLDREASLGSDFLTAATHEEKNTALHEAVRNGHYDVVELLIRENPCLTCLTNRDGESPLFIAVDRKFYNVARKILETFPNCCYSGRNGMTAMHAAVIRLQFISFGYFFWFPTSRKQLQRALSWTKFRIILCGLWSTCVNLTILGFRDACLPNIISENFVMELLEKYGHKILEVQDEYGWMPLHYAARLGNVKVIKLFLETNQSLAYIKDKEGMSALHISAGNGRGAAIYALIEECPDICELLDNKRRTALHVAVETGYMISTNALLRVNAFSYLINEKDLAGNTALHVAALHGHYKILRRLANDNRVDKEAINKVGMTVIDIIRSSGLISNDKKVYYTAMLKSKGSKPSLERRVFVRERIIEQIDEIKRLEMVQKTQLMKVDVLKNINNDEAATTSGSSTTKINEVKKATEKYYGWSPELVKNLANINLLVATIIASITFSAAITMPGGYDNEDGIAILMTKTSFKYFVGFDSLAFGCSTASMSIHFLVAFTSRLIHEKYSYPIAGVLFLTLLSIASTVFAFIAGTHAVLGHYSGFDNSTIIAFFSFTIPIFFYFIRILVVLFRRLHLFVASDM